MNILIADMNGCRYPDIGFQIKSACEQLGHKVRKFDYRKWKLQHLSLTNMFLNAKLAAEAIKWPADVLIVNKGESILPNTISSITKEGIKTVNWNPDEPFGYLAKFNKINNVNEYTAYFTYDKQYLKPLRELNPNSFHLPPGSDPFGVHKEHTPLNLRNFPADLCLVGTAYKNRINLLRKFASYKMRIAGPGWTKAHSSISKQALPHVKITEMVKLFNESKIVFNPYGTSKYFIVPNPRTFEIPATKSFQLTDIPRDIDSFFRPGKEVVVYKDQNEFKELVDYYLENDEERNKIAQAGYDRVVKEHTMLHRVKKLLETVKKLN